MSVRFFASSFRPSPLRLRWRLVVLGVRRCRVRPWRVILCRVVPLLSSLSLPLLPVALDLLIVTLVMLFRVLDGATIFSCHR